MAIHSIPGSVAVSPSVGPPARRRLTVAESVERLRSADVETRRIGAENLMHLSNRDGGAADVLLRGGVEALICVLDDADIAVKTHAILALGWMSSAGEAYRNRIKDAGGITKLVQLLDGNRAISKVIIDTLGNWAVDNVENKAYVQEQIALYPQARETLLRPENTNQVNMSLSFFARNTVTREQNHGADVLSPF